MAGHTLKKMMDHLSPPRLLRDRAGGVLVMVGVLTPVVFGVSALGMDASMWYMERREAQTLSDTGALAGAHLAAENASAAEIEQSVQEALSRNGYQSRDGDTITVNRPPTSGKHAGDSDYVEVVLRRQARLMLASTILDNAGTIGVRSVGGSVPSGKHCVLSLDDTMDAALEFEGTSDVTLDCGVAANSNSDRSISIDGSAKLTADPAQTFGDISISNNATLNTNSPVRTFAPKVEDPYGANGRNLQALIDQALADNPTCDHNNTELVKTPQTLTPGRYCGGIVGKHVTHEFDPGLYIIDEGTLKVEGGGGFTGNGVTFIFTGSSPSDVANVELAGGGTFDLHAPGSGDWRGILFAQDDLADYTTDLSFFKGGSSADLGGAIYFPGSEFEFSGGSSSTNNCLQLIARKVTFSGPGYLDAEGATCTALGVDAVVQKQVKLVE